MLARSQLKPFNGQSSNKMYRAGPWLIKHIDPHGGTLFTNAPHGSVHAEVHSGKLFTTLGLPHLGADYVPGSPEYVRYHFREGLTDIGRLTPAEHQKHRDVLMDPDRHGAIHLAEWLGLIGDRHSGNYALDPQQGLLSIDHGAAFHPNTAFIHHGDPTIREFPSMSPLSNPDAHTIWSKSPNLSALWSLGQVLGYTPEEYGNLVIPRHHVETALNYPDTLIRHTIDGTQGLPEDERKFAVAAMKLRLHYLRSAYTSGQPLRIEKLHDLRRIIQDHVRGRGRQLYTQALQEELREDPS